jgi:hypothetical protein
MHALVFVLKDVGPTSMMTWLSSGGFFAGALVISALLSAGCRVRDGKPSPAQ